MLPKLLVFLLVCAGMRVGLHVCVCVCVYVCLRLFVYECLMVFVYESVCVGVCVVGNACVCPLVSLRPHGF